MRAMILAAGRGKRMGELTRDTPKPLLIVGGKYLIEYSIESLVASGIQEIIINVSYLADQIKAAIGDGSRYGASIYYSYEAEPLETGGGIMQALPQLGPDPFIVMSSDIVSDYHLKRLPKKLLGLAHLVMVDNPPFKPQGDFGFKESYLDLDAKPTYTFANIGMYHPELFAGYEVVHFPLSKVLFPAIKNQLITGEHIQDSWYNVGSQIELLALERYLTRSFC